MNCSSMNWRTSIKAGLGPSPALHPSLLRGPLYILREYRGLAYLYFFLLIIPDLFICSLPSPTTYVFYSFGFIRFDPCTVAICRLLAAFHDYICLSCLSHFSPVMKRGSCQTIFDLGRPWFPEDVWRATSTRTRSLVSDQCFIFKLHPPLLFPHTFWRTSSGTRDKTSELPLLSQTNSLDWLQCLPLTWAHVLSSSFLCFVAEPHDASSSYIIAP